VLFLCGLGAAACSTSSSSPKATPVCPPGPRITLLATTLQRLTPSDAFTLAPSSSAWVGTSARPDTSGLFGGVASIATISAFPAGGSPTLATDAQGFQKSAATVSINKPNEWIRLSIGAGKWRIYTATLGITALPITVVACPA
jgi:hypothetical protein